jgi:hypothetical protein
MITLMVNVYDEDPQPAVASARKYLPISHVITLNGRYAGFPDLSPNFHVPVFASEHEKRNVMLAMAGAADRDRWLLWLDCDERVSYASPMIAEQLAREADRGTEMAGVRFVEPLPRAEKQRHLVAGLDDPGRTLRDHVIECLSGRLHRHLPELRYVDRHDRLYFGERLLGADDPVDVTIEHLWWEQAPTRRAAKQRYYQGPERAAEYAEIQASADRIAARVGADDDELGWGPG